MMLFKTITALENKLNDLRQNSKTIGFVPTMGALHEGHLSLIAQSKQAMDITVCSVFVNPTQFNDSKDFEKYPVTIDKDIRLLGDANTNILFLPSVKEIYPNGLHSSFHYNLGSLENVLEGFYRPGHFQGVCQIVHRLLEIIKPTELFIGQKDYQQCMVIKKVTELYSIDTKINICNTLREVNGLAMSSRNLRLESIARQQASSLFKALSFVKDNIELQNITDLKKIANNIILNGGFEKIDYFEICNAETLLPLLAFKPCTKSIILAAAFIGGVRLIDNLLINE